MRLVSDLFVDLRIAEAILFDVGGAIRRVVLIAASAIPEVFNDVRPVEANEAGARDLLYVRDLVSQQDFVMANDVDATADRDAVDAAHDERSQPPRKADADAW